MDLPWVLVAMVVVAVLVLAILVTLAVVVVRTAARDGIRPRRNRRTRHGGSLGNGGTGLP